MTTKDFRFDPKTNEPSEHSPMVSTLLSVIEKLTDQLSHQSEALSKQSEKINELLTEIRQLKKLSKKPKLRASSLPKDKDDTDDEPPSDGTNSSKRPGSSKRSKNTDLKAACRLFLRNLPGHPSPRQGQKQATSMPPAALAVLVPLDFDPPSGLKIYAPQ